MNKIEKDKYRNMSIQETLEIVESIGNTGKKDELIEYIGETQMETLCTLGYIAIGVGIDDNGSSYDMWRRTSKINLYKEMEKPLSGEDAKIGTALLIIGF